MPASDDTSPPTPPSGATGTLDGTVRDPLANPAAVLAARRRPMSERLELALSWNKLAGDLRAGLGAARRDAVREP